MSRQFRRHGQSDRTGANYKTSKDALRMKGTSNPAVNRNASTSKGPVGESRGPRSLAESRALLGECFPILRLGFTVETSNVEGATVGRTCEYAGIAKKSLQGRTLFGAWRQLLYD